MGIKSDTVAQQTRNAGENAYQESFIRVLGGCSTNVSYMCHTCVIVLTLERRDQAADKSDLLSSDLE